METPLWQKPAQQMLDEQKSTKMRWALQGNPGGRIRGERLPASLVNLDGTAILKQSAWYDHQSLGLPPKRENVPVDASHKHIRCKETNGTGQETIYGASEEAVAEKQQSGDEAGNV